MDNTESQNPVDPTEDEIQGQFDAAFAEPAAGDKPKDETTALDEAAGEFDDESDTVTETPDPWASAPKDLRKSYEELQRNYQHQQQIAFSHRGRVQALQRQLNEIQAAGKPAATPSKDAGAQAPATPSAEQIAAAVKSPQGLERLKDEYPEIADALQETATQLRTEMRRELDTVRQSVQPARQLVSDVDAANREAAVEAAHPGWKQSIQTPEFQGWLSQQPDFVLAGMESEDPREAIGLLSMFKQSRGAPVTGARRAPTLDPRLARAAAAPSRRQASPKPADESDFDAVFNAITANG